MKPLDERTANPNTILEFKKWLALARTAGLKEPTAMTLATTTSEGKPSARMVLLKGVDEMGFSFFSNYTKPQGARIGSKSQGGPGFLLGRIGPAGAYHGSRFKTERRRIRLVFCVAAARQPLWRRGFETKLGHRIAGGY